MYQWGVMLLGSFNQKLQIETNHTAQTLGVNLKEIFSFISVKEHGLQGG